jgi:hypothetical protein
MLGVSPLNVTVKVTELNSVNTNGTITVRIPKDSRVTFTYNSALTAVGFVAVNNSAWTYNGTNPFFHVFTTTSVITAGGSSTFGFVGSFNPLNTNGTVNMTATPIATAAFNAQGIASFTTPKVGDKFGVVITPATGTAYLDNVVTVSDAYKAFLQNASVGIAGTTNYFQYPTLEKKIGNVTIANSTFGNDDAYNLFSYVMGISVSAKATIPSKAATSYGFLFGKKDVWHTGVLTDNIVEVTSATQTNDFAFAYSGDLDYSNSTDPASITGAVIGMSVNQNETVTKTKSNSNGVV